ncbi:hypothetical protein Trydic_g13267 [Trypoxylus dichotomus]
MLTALGPVIGELRVQHRQHPDAGRKFLSEEDTKKKFDATTANDMKSPNKESGKSDPLLNYFNVEVCNRYGVLADKRMEMEVQDEEQPRPSTSTAQEGEQHEKRSGTSNAKPPALCFISRMKERFREFKQMINSVSTEYYVQFSGENTLVYFKKLDDYRRFVERYSNEVPFYTYTPRAEKTLAYLIKGLHYECECEDVKNELLELNVCVKTVVKFKNTKHPIFMITVPKSVTIKQLQVQVRYLQHTKIYFEPHRSKKDLIQCKKCQAWGHATANCFLKVTRCVKCAEEHRSFLCKKDREQPARCCNCGGDHPASSTQCPAYKKALAEKQRKSKPAQRKAEAQTRYVPAPLPTRNAWDRRDFPALPTKVDKSRERSPVAPAPSNPQTREVVRAPRGVNHAPPRRKPRPSRTREPITYGGQPTAANNERARCTGNEGLVSARE